MSEIEEVTTTIKRARKLIQLYDVNSQNFNLSDQLDNYIVMFENALKTPHLLFENYYRINLEMFQELNDIIKENKTDLKNIKKYKSIS